MTTLLPKLSIVGFGSQAKAWALNLRDSNQDVTILLKPQSPSKKLASEMGFHVKELTEDLSTYCIVMLLIPDDEHLNFFEHYAINFKKKTHFIYGHGFSLTKHPLKKNYAHFYHSLLAPKAIASEVRFQYETFGKLGAAISPATPELKKELVELAHNVGIRALYETKIEDETKADLFSEQSLLCSVLPYVSLYSYNLLRKKGIQKEIAFMECFLELKSISKAFVSLGPEAFFKLISPNALLGSEKGKNYLLGEDFKTNLEILMNEIDNGQFFKEAEVDSAPIRKTILSRWQNEELTQTFNELKDELID